VQRAIAREAHQYVISRVRPRALVVTVEHIGGITAKCRHADAFADDDQRVVLRNTVVATMTRFSVLLCETRSTINSSAPLSSMIGSVIFPGSRVEPMRACKIAVVVIAAATDSG
jgi:hypothetical protein